MVNVLRNRLNRRDLEMCLKRIKIKIKTKTKTKIEIETYMNIV